MNVRAYFMLLVSALLLTNNVCAVVYPPCPDGVWQLVSKTNSDIHEVGTRIDALSTAVDETTSAIEEALPEIESGLELIDDAVSNLNDAITTLEEYTFSMIETIGSLAIPIMSTPYTITETGLYTLGAVLTGPIIIDADYVTFDMLGYALASGLSEQYGIIVLPGHHHITVENGIVDSMATAGIAVLGSDTQQCSDITIKHMSVSNCSIGIHVEHCSNSIIADCLLQQNSNGLVLERVERTVIENCAAVANSAIGFGLYSSRYNNFYRCKAIGTYGDQVNGFYSQWGELNTWDACVIEETESTANDMPAYGIHLDSEAGSAVVRSTASGVQASGSAVGIQIPEVIAQVDAPSVLAIAWSSDNKYLAAVGPEFIDVYEFNATENSLVRKAHQEIAGVANSVSWTPDNLNLAVGVIDGTIGVIDTYTFNGNNLLYSQSFAFGGGSAVHDVAFSPTAIAPNYLAVVGEYSDNNGTAFVDIFSFTPGPAGSLDKISEKKYRFAGDSMSNKFTAVSWKSDGTRLVAGGSGSVSTAGNVYQNGMLSVYVVSLAGILTNKASLQIFPYSFKPEDDVNINTIAWQAGSNYFVVSGASVVGSFNRYAPFGLYEFTGSAINLIDSSTGKEGSQGWDISWNPLFSTRGIVAISGFDSGYLFSFELRNDILIFSDTGSPVVTPLVQWSVAHLALYDQVNQKIIVVSFGTANHVEYCNVHGVHGGKGGVGIAGSDYLANFFGNNRGWDNDRNYSNGINPVNGYSSRSYQNVSYT